MSGRNQNKRRRSAKSMKRKDQRSGYRKVKR